MIDEMDVCTDKLCQVFRRGRSCKHIQSQQGVLVALVQGVNSIVVATYGEKGYPVRWSCTMEVELASATELASVNREEDAFCTVQVTW